MSRRSVLSRAAALALESLEARQHFTVTVVGAIPDQSVRPGAANSLFPLASIFQTTNLNNVTGTVVSFPVAYGVGAAKVSSYINMELFDQTPLTTQNFLRYINNGRYDDTIVHRAEMGRLIQAGGYTSGGNAIPTFSSVANEFSSSPRDAQGRVNTRGTVAMAKIDGQPNSATSQWFINLTDNSALLDNSNGGYTTFARLFSGSLATADAIAALPTVSLSETFPKLPVANLPPGSTNPAPENLVVFDDPEVIEDPKTYFTYTITSSNTGVVAVSRDDAGNLVLDYGNKSGTATVTVTATDLTGASVSDTITVTVGSPKFEATFGTTKLADNQATTVDFGSAFKGQTATRTLLLKNTGDTPLSLGQITVPQGVTVVGTPPASLAANESYSLVLSFDTAADGTISGEVSIPTDSPDVQDGAFSFPIAIDVGSGVTLGAGGAKSVTYKDADGTVVVYTLKGPGSATLGFAGSNLAVTQDPAGKLATVTGDGVLLMSMDLVDTTGASSLSATAKSGDGSATLAGLTSAGPLKSLALSKISLTGSLTANAGVGDVAFASVVGGIINVGGNAASAPVKSVKLGTVTNGDVTVVGVIKAVTAATLGDSFLTLNGPVSKLSANSVSNTSITIGGSIAGLTVKGGVTNSTVLAGGSVGKVSVGTFVNSRLASGLVGEVTVPAAASDFAAGSSVAGFKVTSKTADPFSGSSLFAANIGKISLGSLSNAGAESRIIAAGSIAQLAGRPTGGKAFSLKAINPTTPVDTTLPELGVPVSRLDVSFVS